MIVYGQITFLKLFRCFLFVFFIYFLDLHKNFEIITKLGRKRKTTKENSKNIEGRAA